MGSAISVCSQKAEKFEFDRIREKNRIWRQSDLNPGPSELKSSAFPLSYSLKLERKKFGWDVICPVGVVRTPPGTK